MIKIVHILLVSLLLVACSESGEKKSAKYLDKANVLFEQENYTKAALEYKNALQAEPANVDAHLKLAETHLKLEDPRNAYISYTRALTLDPENIEAKLKLASFFFLMKKYDEARNNVAQVLKEAAAEHRSADVKSRIVY